MPRATPRKPGRPKDPVRRAQRRREILDAAMRVFARRGYAETDLQVVAKVLNVSRGTLYRYFSTKRILFLAAVEDGMRQLTEAIDAACAGASDPLQRLAQAMYGYLAFFDARPEVVELIIQERAHFRDRAKPTYFQHRDANRAAWRELIEGIIATGTLRPLSADRIMDIMGDLVYGMMFTNYLAGRTRSLEEQYHDAIDITFFGILSDGARKLLPDDFAQQALTQASAALARMAGGDDGTH